MNIQRISTLVAAASVVCLLILSVPCVAIATSSDDAAITQEVTKALGSLSNSVKVRTVDGKVFLRGQVTFAEDAAHAEWKARRVPGVRSVNANINFVTNHSGQ